MVELTPREIVKELDRYIVGQDQAKRAVAVALRNRYRRRQLPPGLQEEVTPKNILMIGPTGVGKTEIARRLARLAGAPFLKVEATKFTEVGYVGRDVESIVRDLAEISVRMVRSGKRAEVREQAEAHARERLIDIMVPSKSERSPYDPLSALLGFSAGKSRGDEEDEEKAAERRRRRAEIRSRLATGEIDEAVVEIEVEDTSNPVLEVFSPQGIEEMGINLQDLFGGILPKKKKKRRMKVKEALEYLTGEEAEKLIDQESVRSEAIRLAEDSGIVFIDEIDKIAATEGKGSGPDVSREGVQRDILPIIEGTTVMTKYGPLRTDHILFIAAGAFHVAKPSDLIPELQGRLPIRVELESLSASDFYRILTEPENALVKQYTELLATEGVRLKFTEDGIREIAETAHMVNETTENIGARRLYTVMERVLAAISFEADSYQGQTFVVDTQYVRGQLKEIAVDRDLSRYIL